MKIATKFLQLIMLIAVTSLFAGCGKDDPAAASESSTVTIQGSGSAN